MPEVVSSGNQGFSNLAVGERVGNPTLSDGRSAGWRRATATPQRPDNEHQSQTYHHEHRRGRRGFLLMPPWLRAAELKRSNGANEGERRREASPNDCGGGPAGRATRGSVGSSQPLQATPLSPFFSVSPFLRVERGCRSNQQRCASYGRGRSLDVMMRSNAATRSSNRRTRSCKDAGAAAAGRSSAIRRASMRFSFSRAIRSRMRLNSTSS